MSCRNLKKLKLIDLQLWVSPGSRAANGKNYFYSHLAPFYRIERLGFKMFLVVTAIVDNWVAEGTSYSKNWRTILSLILLSSQMLDKAFSIAMCSKDKGVIRVTLEG